MGVEYVRRFGPLGLGAWILRDDVKEAVQVILRLVDAVPGVNMRDLAGGLYYLFTLRKGEQVRTLIENPIELTSTMCSMGP